MYRPWKVVTPTADGVAPMASFSTVESSTLSARTLCVAPPCCWLLRGGGTAGRPARLDTGLQSGASMQPFWF